MYLDTEKIYIYFLGVDRINKMNVSLQKMEPIGQIHMHMCHTRIENNIQKLENRHVPRASGMFLIINHIPGHTLSLYQYKTPTSGSLGLLPTPSLLSQWPWKQLHRRTHRHTAAGANRSTEGHMQHCTFHRKHSSSQKKRPVFEVLKFKRCHLSQVVEEE